MNCLLDTNILLLYLRENRSLATQVDEKFAPLSTSNISVLSVATLGEIRSIAIQNQWGKTRIEKLFQFVQKFPVADINIESIIQRYAEIDAFSQGKLQGTPLATSARNMGKNDHWIAATASVLGLVLLTTDQDFDHLKGKFLEVAYLNTATL
jgi:tRNA(fMet)-specific endonuclease VapC